MGVVVVPGRFVAPADEVGRLVHTLLSVAVASAVERQRLQRARQLVADGAVLRLELSPGTLTARVQGSRSEPYAVRVEVPTVRPPVLVDGVLRRSEVPALVPDVGQVRTSCTCPDWEEPCKHSVAAVLALGAELQMRPILLLEWRCSADGEPSAAGATPAAPASDQHPEPSAPFPRPSLHLAPDLAGDRAGGGVGGSAARTAPSDDAAVPGRRRPLPEQSAMAHADWPDFVGSLPLPPLPEVPDVLPPIGRQVVGLIDLSDWLGTVQAALRAAHGAG